MKLFKFNYFANHEIHVGELWALSRYDAEKMILSANPKANAIDIWLS